MVVDNYSTYKHEKVQNLVETAYTCRAPLHPDQFIMAQWVERFWGMLTEKRLKRRVLTSVAALEHAIIWVYGSTQYKPTTICPDKLR